LRTFFTQRRKAAKKIRKARHCRLENLSADRGSIGSELIQKTHRAAVLPECTC